MSLFIFRDIWINGHATYFLSIGPVSFGYAELENNNAQQASILTDFASQTTPGMNYEILLQNVWFGITPLIKHFLILGIDRSGLSLKSELKSPLESNKSESSPSKRNFLLFCVPYLYIIILDLSYWV